MTANTNTNTTINPATETSTDSARAQPLFTYGGTDYYTAEEAAEAGFAQCEECGDWVPEDETFSTANGLVCNDCIDDYCECTCCGETVRADDGYWVNRYMYIGERPEPVFYCDSCASTSRNVQTCGVCGEMYTSDDCIGDRDSEIQTYDGTWVDICPDCLIDNYIECEECGEWVSLDDAVDGFCPNCHESDLESYKHTNELGFHAYRAADGEAGLFIGVELETENANNRETARAVKDAVAQCEGCSRDSVVCKRDGSLDDGGCEIVTAPFSPALHLQTGFWDAVTDAASCYSHNCGMHVHISRAYFTSDTERYLFARLFFRFGKRFRNFAGRGDTYYSRWANAEWFGIDLRETPDTRFKQFMRGMERYRDSYGRYTAVNFCPRETIEVRAFAATLDPSRIRDFVAVVYANAVIANTTPDAINVIESYTFDEYKARLLEVIGERFPEFDTSGIVARFV